METTQIPQDILKIRDIRQSDEWLEYLRLFGWKKHKLSTGTNIAVLNMGFSRFAKIQRPLNLTDDDLLELNDFAKSAKLSFAKIEPSLSQSLELFETQGYRLSNGFMSPPATLFIDLRQSEKELWHGFSHSAKYSINRAVREGARVEHFVAPTDEQIKVFYKLISVTTMRKKFKTIALPHLIEKNKLFGKKAFLFLVYDKNGKLTGGKYFAGFNNCVWYMYGGTSDEGRKNKAGYSLVWESFKELKRIGYDWLDFEGVDDKRVTYSRNWGGFAHFKEKFGGVRVEYPFPRVKYYSKLFDTMARITKFDV